MWFLHVVAIQGNGSWQTAVVFWVVTAVVGGCLAYLAGEWLRPDALLIDLALAAAGGAAGNAASAPIGSDLLALIYGVRTFWAALGALLLVGLMHDVAQLAAERQPGLVLPLSGESGGLLSLVTWLSGWPSEPGLVEATYNGSDAGSGGLPLRLLPEALYYQVAHGPFRTARAVPLLPGLVAEIEGSALLLRGEQGSRAAERLHSPVRLPDITPPDAVARIATEIHRQRVAAQPPVN